MTLQSRRLIFRSIGSPPRGPRVRRPAPEARTLPHWASAPEHTNRKRGEDFDLAGKGRIGLTGLWWLHELLCSVWGGRQPRSHHVTPPSRSSPRTRNLGNDQHASSYTSPINAPGRLGRPDLRETGTHLPEEDIPGFRTSHPTPRSEPIGGTQGAEGRLGVRGNSGNRIPPPPIITLLGSWVVGAQLRLPVSVMPFRDRVFSSGATLSTVDQMVSPC